MTNAPATERRSVRWALLGLAVAAGVAIYARNLNDYFVADDFDLILSFYGEGPLYSLKLLFWNESNRIWSDLGLDPDLGTGYLRPLKIWLLQLDFAVWGTRSAGYHVTATLLFVMNIVLAFRILERLAPGGPAIPFLGAFGVAIHPVFSEIVPFITAREETLATGCGLLAVWYFLRFRAGDAPGWPVYVAYVAGLWTKESAISNIGIVACWDLACWLVHERSWPRLRDRLRFWIPLPLIWGLYFVQRWIAFGSLVGGDNESTQFGPEALLQFHTTFFRFLTHRLMLSLHALPGIGWILLAAVVGLLAVVVWRRRHQPRAYWAALLFVGPLWYLNATAVVSGSYFTPRHNVMAVVGLGLFVAMLLYGALRGADRVAVWATTVSVAAIAAALFVPPCVTMSVAYDRASRTVASMRYDIELNTADLPDGAAVRLEDIPQLQLPPWYFGYGLLSALKLPFTETDVGNRLQIINERNIWLNSYPIEPPTRYDRVLRMTPVSERSPDDEPISKAPPRSVRP